MSFSLPIGSYRSRAHRLLAHTAVVGAFLLPFHSVIAQTLTWEIPSNVLYNTTSVINLRNKENATVATVSTSQLRKLYQVKEKIGAAASLGYVRLVVTNDDKPNAFAGSKDGNRAIGFTLGMLRLLGEDEGLMAAVMGHEFGHLVKNHQGRGERRALAEVFGLFAGIVAGRYIANPLGADLAGRGANLTGRAVIHSYDRDQEREADAFGVEVMARAGYDPNAAVRYWSDLHGKNTGGFFSTHPANEERLANVRNLAMAYARQVDAPKPAVLTQATSIAAPAQQPETSPDIGKGRLPACLGAYTPATWTECVGTYVFRNGARYTGEWKNGKEHGQGAITFPDGGRFVGGYRDGVRHGDGIEYRPDGSVLQSGIWRHGTFQGAPPDVAKRRDQELETAVVSQPKRDQESKTIDQLKDVARTNLLDGRYEDAIQGYKKWIHLEPQNGDAWYELGIAYRKDNQIDNVREVYRLLLRIDEKLAKKLFDVALLPP